MSSLGSDSLPLDNRQLRSPTPDSWSLLAYRSRSDPLLTSLGWVPGLGVTPSDPLCCPKLIRGNARMLPHRCSRSSFIWSQMSVLVTTEFLFMYVPIPRSFSNFAIFCREITSVNDIVHDIGYHTVQINTWKLLVASFCQPFHEESALLPIVDFLL